MALQTLYSAWGSKQALFRASLEHVLSDGRGIDETWPQQLQDRLRTGASRDSTERGFARALAALVRATAEGAATAWLTYRNAAGSDPTIAEDWSRLSLLRHGTVRALLEVQLDVGVAVDDAWVDTTWVLTSPEVFDLLARIRDYDLDTYEEWLANTLRATLSTRITPDPRSAPQPTESAPAIAASHQQGTANDTATQGTLTVPVAPATTTGQTIQASQS